MDIKIRRAEKKDIPGVFSLVRQMAEYEKRADQVKISQKRFLEDYLRGEAFELIVAEAAGKMAGFAVYYPSYSTWKGKCLYLHEIFVPERFRRRGIGAKLFEKVLAEAKKRKVGRVEWRVLKWNEPALDFYKKYGAKMDHEWVECELEKRQLEDMGP